MNTLPIGKTVAAVLVLVLVSLPKAFAQESASISVSGTVIAGLSVDSQQNLTFGDIIAGEQKRVNLDGSATGASPGEEQAGIFRISTLGSFTVSFTEIPSAMTGTGENNSGESMPITFFSAWNTSLTPPEAGNEVSVTENTPIVVNNSGTELDYYVFLGAEVDPPLSQAQGLYETTVTLTATFGID